MKAEGARWGRMTLLVFTLLLGQLYVGFVIAVLALYSNKVTSDLFQIPSQFQYGLANGLVFLTGAFGAYSVSLLLPLITRRNTLLLSSLVALIGGLLVICEPSLPLLLAGRAVQGLAFGVFSTVVPLMNKEFSPKHMSSVTCVLNQAFIVLGVLSVYVNHLLIDSDEPPGPIAWRFYYSWIYIPLALQIVLLISWCPSHTPKELILQGKDESARQVLNWIYLDHAVEQVFDQKKLDFKKYSSQLLVKGPRSPGYKMRLLVAFSLPLTHQLSGINILNVYINQIFSFSPYLSRSIGTYFNILKLAACLTTASLSLKFGRRPLILTGSLGIVVGNVMLGTGFALSKDSTLAIALQVIGSCVIFSSFGCSVGSVIWQYLPEIVSPTIMGYATLLVWLVSFLTVTFYPSLQAIIGSSLIFYGLAVIVLAIWIFQYLHIKETKGLTEAQIITAFQPVGEGQQKLLLEDRQSFE